MDHYDPRRTSSLDGHPRRDSRVQFLRPSSSQSRDSSFSRQQGQNSSYSRSRDQSPAHHRNSHNNKGRIQTTNIDFKTTIEADDQIVRGTIAIGIQIRITEIVLSDQTVTVVIKNKQVYRENHLPVAEIYNLLQLRKTRTYC